MSIGLIVEEKSNNVTHKDVLLWYCKKCPHLITEDLYFAGQRFLGLWEKFCVSCKGNRKNNLLGGCPSRSLGGSREAIFLLTQVDAESVIRAALDFVGGPDLDTVLTDILCHRKNMSEIEHRLHFRRGGGVVALRIALYRLFLYWRHIDKKHKRN